MYRDQGLKSGTAWLSTTNWFGNLKYRTELYLLATRKSETYSRILVMDLKTLSRAGLKLVCDQLSFTHIWIRAGGVYWDKGTNPHQFF